MAPFGFFAKPFDGGLMIDCIERALAAEELHG